MENNKQTLLPPRRGQVKKRVFQSIVNFATPFASLPGGDGGRKNINGNGIEDGGVSPSTTPPIPIGYDSDR